MNFTQKSILQGCIFVFLGIIIGYGVTTFPTKTVADGQKTQAVDSIFFSKKVQESIDIIKNNYYGFSTKNPQDIQDEMISALAKSLWDKHSSYFTPKEAEEFEQSLSGDFEGIGAVINESMHGIKILRVLDGSPAEKAWLKAWDVITMVDSGSVIGESVDTAISKIRWPKWSSVKITYIRWDNEALNTIEVVRDVVNVPSVSYKILKNNIGYIEVSVFGENTARDFVNGFNTLVGSGAQWMILDFRNNGGGLLNTAIDLASTVLPQNSSVVIIKENDPTKNQTLYTQIGAKSNTTIPIIVLINWFSASASEIFAWALQDHARAIILGEQSYGKGSVQEPFDLGDGSILKITTARWYTPDDRGIDDKGITPDIQVFLRDQDYTDANDRQLDAAETILIDEIKNKTPVPEEIKKFQDNTFNNN